jgi:serine/threonine protein kinase
VQVFDIGMRDGVVELAMEYLHGRTLEDVLARESRLPLDAAVTIAIAVAEGLHHAHTRASPIVHRDVSPSNVMITYDGSVKLIDFGIAKAANNLSNTVYGTFKGRLGYSSPEQCRCELTDARTDIYSLSVMLYEMTTGARAFTAATEDAMLAAMTEARIAPPSSVDPRFPRPLEAILMTGLVADRARRYATAEDMQRDLEAFARSAQLANVSEGALSRLMNDLFASDLATWIHARDAGVTLEDHVLRNVTATLADHAPQPELDLDRATTMLPPRRKRPTRRAWVLPALVVALVAVAYVVTRLVLTAP